MCCWARPRCLCANLQSLTWGFASYGRSGDASGMRRSAGRLAQRLWTVSAVAYRTCEQRHAPAPDVAHHVVDTIWWTALCVGHCALERLVGSPALVDYSFRTCGNAPRFVACPFRGGSLSRVLSERVCDRWPAIQLVLGMGTWYVVALDLGTHRMVGTAKWAAAPCPAVQAVILTSHRISPARSTLSDAGAVPLPLRAPRHPAHPPGSDTRGRKCSRSAEC